MERLFRPYNTTEEGLNSINALKVICMLFVILGSTFFRVLQGAIQNMQVLQIWVHYFSFSFILASDFIIDVFFVISAFLATYFLLKKIQKNEGELESYAVYFMHLYLRYTPLYAFNLFFFWKVISLFGDGPNFFMYNEVSQCKNRWFFHLLYINNLIPFVSDDNCMGWTWFLANNFQFLLLVPIFAILYYKKKNIFWIVVGSAGAACFLFDIIVVATGDLSASYFNYN